LKKMEEKHFSFNQQFSNFMQQPPKIKDMSEAYFSRTLYLLLLSNAFKHGEKV